MTDAFPTLLPLLAAQGVTPRKGLGQHYLSDPAILQGIVDAAALPAGAVVIEVGPGPGTLTAALAAVAGRLIAVELDAYLAELLAELYRPYAHVHIVAGDALAKPPAALLAETAGADGGAAPYFLVANLPYYITSPLLRHYLEADPPPQRAVVTIQRDVARRILAAPPQMSLLALAVQVYAQ
ncbi:MAG: 16S rRNA (adenine(1518)-N(6)/adenine(1519)-N(6))-dimethyltransferase, partial [Caldilineales bacterium]|nr:16S rRNA (adenine(1518)-N(6)/adenine(1519)-N(6))-dimethyltransferase [Caldilineales bacterium]